MENQDPLLLEETLAEIREETMRLRDQLKMIDDDLAELKKMVEKSRTTQP